MTDLDLKRYYNLVLWQLKWRCPMRWLLAVLLIFPSVVWAQEDLGRCVGPNERVARTDTAFFESFSLGGSIDLTPDQTERFDEFIRSVGPDQNLCFRGTADTTRWNPRYGEREWYRVNHSLAESRAHWAWERAGRRGQTLEPFLNHPQRGVYVYRLGVEAVAESVEGTPIETEQPQVVEIRPYQPARADVPPPTLIPVVRSTNAAGFGLGFVGLSAGGLDFASPVVSFVFGNSVWQAALTGGWRPRSANQYGKRYETLLAGEIVLYPPHSRLGLALGALGTWRALRDEDEYLERAYGPFAGLRLLLGSSPALILGADAVYANVSVYGQDSSRWRWGFLPLARFDITF